MPLRSATYHGDALPSTESGALEEDSRRSQRLRQQGASRNHQRMSRRREAVRVHVVGCNQVMKYRNTALKLIPRTGHSDWPLDIVCLMGKGPPEWDADPGLVRRMLAPLRARLVFYDELLDNSRRAYAEYLEQHRKVDRLSGIFDAIDDFAAAQVD